MHSIHPIIGSLIRRGLWPVGELNPLSVEVVQSVAPGEDRLCLSAPENFRTVKSEAELGVPEFWKKYGALSELDSARALIIGDFGLGSDAPIVIDSDFRIQDPRVMRLAWGVFEGGAKTCWVTFFERLSEFAAFLETHLRPNA